MSKRHRRKILLKSVRHRSIAHEPANTEQFEPLETSIGYALMDRIVIEWVKSKYFEYLLDFDWQ